MLAPVSASPLVCFCQTPSFDLQKSTMVPSCLGTDAQMGLVEEKGGTNGS